MPYTKVGVSKVSNHYVMSPLKNDLKPCMQCHKGSAGWLRDQVIAIQDWTVSQMVRSGYATATVAKLFEMANKAQESGKKIDMTLYNKAKDYYEESFYRDVFVDAENSAGFHNPTEAIESSAMRPLLRQRPRGS